MTDPFERLEQQLRSAVRENVPARRAWWRPLRGGALAVGGALVISGGAFAATRIVGSGQSAETQGRKIAFRAVQDTSTTAGCRPVQDDHGTSDAAPLPAIVAALPLVGAPADPVTALGRFPHPGLLRSTVHRRLLPGGFRVTVFVVAGGGGGPALRDAAACRAARRARAEELLVGRSAAARAWALRRLDELTDTAPGIQTLWILTAPPGRPGPGGGAGTPVRPGRAIPRGALGGSSSGDRGSTYSGIVPPGVASVRVRPQHRVAPFCRRTVDGLFAVRLPNRSGRATLEELDADGRWVGGFRLR